MEVERLLDKEGFLFDIASWNPTVAEILAKRLEITLTEDHWLVIYATRKFFNEFDTSPSMRLLIKWLKQEDLHRLANSIQLLRLFPGSPAKLCAQLGGLPKPDNCL